MDNCTENLCEILQGYEGNIFYSDVFGLVTLKKVTNTYITIAWGNIDINLYPDGSKVVGERCVIFPSKEQRDWTIWLNEQTKELTYDAIESKLGDVIDTTVRCHTPQQINQIHAISKLMNVQLYIEKDWKPDFTDVMTNKWYIHVDRNNKITVSSHNLRVTSSVYFSSEANARKAIGILGEETIRTALSYSKTPN